MQATVKEIQTTTAVAEEPKSKELQEAVRELASFELSLVGGGYGSLSFA